VWIFWTGLTGEENGAKVLMGEFMYKGGTVMVGKLQMKKSNI